jgi:hypothetical protein
MTTEKKIPFVWTLVLVVVVWFAIGAGAYVAGQLARAALT